MVFRWSCRRSSCSNLRGRPVVDFLLIGLVLLLTAAGQVLQKLGADHAARPDGNSGYIRRALSRKEIHRAIICLAIATALWLVVLYRMDVSKAFPILSLNFVVVLVASRWILSETITPERWIGATLITIGVLLVAAT